MLYKNDLVVVEIEPSEVPWVKVFTKREVKEFSQCSAAEKVEIFRVLDITEKLMLAYFDADKVNIEDKGKIRGHKH